MTIIFVLVVDVFMNEECEYCVLPESFVDYHVEKMSSSSSISQTSNPVDTSNLTNSDIQTMQTILDKLRSANK